MAIVLAGEASRAAVVSKALRRNRRQVLAEQDAEIYRPTGGYPDLDDWGLDRGQSTPID